jgi:hypothetical protein
MVIGTGNYIFNYHTITTKTVPCFIKCLNFVTGEFHGAGETYFWSIWPYGNYTFEYDTRPHTPKSSDWKQYLFNTISDWHFLWVRERNYFYGEPWPESFFFFLLVRSFFQGFFSRLICVYSSMHKMKTK